MTEEQATANPEAPHEGATFYDLTVADIPGEVALINEIELGFVSTMPNSFITLYYQNIVKCPDWRCRVLKKEDAILGFHILTIGKLIPRHAPFFVTPFRFLLIALLYVKPLLRILHYYLWELRIFRQQTSYRGHYDSELVYIGIRKATQGKGFGGLLMGDMRRILEKEGVSYLGTEYHKDDAQAVRFYKKYNYEKLGDINTGSKLSVSLRYPVSGLPVLPATKPAGRVEPHNRDRRYAIPSQA